MTIRIFPKAEREQFWSAHTIENYFLSAAKITRVSYHTTHRPTEELDDQIAYFEAELARQNQMFDSAGFDQDAYLGKIKEAIAREAKFVASAPAGLKNETLGRLLFMQKELDALQAELAGAGE
jgi:hypothetical protein